MLDTILCWFWKSPRARIIETHKHPYYEILVISSGTYEYEVKNQKYVARAGDVVIYPPGLVHTEQNPPEDPPEVYIIHFNWNGMPHKLPLSIRDRDGRLRVIAEWLYRYWVHFSGLWEKVRDGYLHGIVAEVLRLMERPEYELVTQIRHYIFEHMNEPLTLAKLARQANLGRSRFAYLYRQLSGVTPMNDVRQIRLEEAKRLLLCTDTPRKIVAERVGFSCPSSFSNAMRKHRGLTPSQLRKK